MEASHHPGITPALSLSQILGKSVKCLDAFQDRQVFLRIYERPHQKNRSSPFPINVTDDVYLLEILVSCSKGIANLLPLPTCVSFCLS